MRSFIGQVIVPERPAPRYAGWAGRERRAQANALSRNWICCGVSRHPEASQFSITRRVRLDLGIAITLGREVHQLSATWAGVFPVSFAILANACILRLVRKRGSAASRPSSSGV